jgi:hypothetical protein
MITSQITYPSSPSSTRREGNFLGIPNGCFDGEGRAGTPRDPKDLYGYPFGAGRMSGVCVSVWVWVVTVVNVVMKGRR